MTTTRPPSPLKLIQPDSPPAGSVTEITPDILWVRCGLPFRLNHVNLWLLRDGDGWAVLDTGLGHETTKNIWNDVLKDRKLTCVIASHYHPDHIGCAGWLVEQHKVPFFAPLTEWSFGRMISLVNGADYVRIITDYYTHFGLAGERYSSVLEYGNHYARNVTPLPTQLQRLRTGDNLRIGKLDWRVMTFGGHTPEHACLYNSTEKILLAGDQILPFISPNISVSFYEMDADPLSEYLASLRSLRQLPEDTLVLPCHGIPFRNLHLRIDQLETHHAERLQEIVEYCSEPRTVAEIMDMLFPQQLDPHQIMFAIGEAAAHANHLVVQGKLNKIDGDVRRYVRR